MWGLIPDSWDFGHGGKDRASTRPGAVSNGLVAEPGSFAVAAASTAARSRVMSPAQSGLAVPSRSRTGAVMPAAGAGGSTDSGHYPRDERLPSESDLMREFEVGRTTVRLAIAELRKRGLAETVSTRGTYVVKELPAPAAD
jgi:hypothetical protein